MKKYIYLLLVLNFISCNPVELYIDFVKQMASNNLVSDIESEVVEVLNEAKEKKPDYGEEFLLKLFSAQTQLGYINETDKGYDKDKIKGYQDEIEKIALEQFAYDVLETEKLKKENLFILQELVDLDLAFRSQFKKKRKLLEENKIPKIELKTGQCTINLYNDKNEFSLDVPLTNMAFTKTLEIKENQYKSKTLLRFYIKEFTDMNTKEKVEKFLMERFKKGRLIELANTYSLGEEVKDKMYFGLSEQEVDCNKTENFIKKFNEVKEFSKKLISSYQKARRNPTRFDLSAEQLKSVLKKYQLESFRLKI